MSEENAQVENLSAQELPPEAEAQEEQQEEGKCSRLTPEIPDDSHNLDDMSYKEVSEISEATQESYPDGYI